MTGGDDDRRQGRARHDLRRSKRGARAAAEAVKRHLEGRAEDLPLVFLGRIPVANDQMSPDELNALEQKPFRLSGDGALQR